MCTVAQKAEAMPAPGERLWAALLLIRLPANMPEKAVEDGTNAWDCMPPWASPKAPGSSPASALMEHFQSRRE